MVADAPAVLVVGEVIVDVVIGTGDEPPRLRLGGVFHACRALWALGVPYGLAYIAPSYIAPLAEDFARKHGAARVSSVGVVSGSPNVVLIQDPLETRSQGYEFLLRESHDCVLSTDAIVEAVSWGAPDVLLFPTNFDAECVLAIAADKGMRVHADIANAPQPSDLLAAIAPRLATLITSTSSAHFLTAYGGKPDLLIEAELGRGAESVILKENRGGARFAHRDGRRLEVGTQLRPTLNSVGVGDAFDATYVALSESDVATALAYASWVAAEYAATTYPDDFRRGVERCRRLSAADIASIPGLRLPWEARQDVRIYIAAADFDYVDTSLIEQVCAALRYHNFSPHRPVRENGQATPTSTNAERVELYNRDVELLLQCQLLVAVYEHDDPGTLVELGLAAGLKIPTVLFDPHRKVQNPMLLGVPQVIVHELDELLAHVFTRFGSLVPE